ncbi:hypothetical protein BGX38DRAFT_1146329 [Terfezia claveryi]|nr:hypothetical protein BGX38DRAFT_1146329 [Terfezia claveryi]
MVQDFLGHVGRLTIFDHIWSRLPPFRVYQAKQGIRAVNNSKGKDEEFAMGTAGRLHGCTKSENRRPCNCHSIQGILPQGNPVHPRNNTIYEDYLQDFHKHKEVFLWFRSSKFTKASAKTHYNLPDLLTLTARYLARYPYWQSSDTETDIARLMDALLEAFIILQVAVPTFNDDGHMIHHLHCMGVSGGLDGKVPARLNALFKLRDIAAKDTYCLAHVSLMTIVGSLTPDGPEGMVRVGLPSTDHVIRIADIESMAHLIPIHDEELYIVNNRIDLHTWNDIHDGN